MAQGRRSAKLILPKMIDLSQANYHCHAFESHAHLKVGSGTPKYPVPPDFSLVLVLVHFKDPMPYTIAERQHPDKRVIAYAIGEETACKGIAEQDFIAGKTVFEVADKLAKIVPPGDGADDDED